MSVFLIRVFEQKAVPIGITMLCTCKRNSFLSVYDEVAAVAVLG